MIHLVNVKYAGLQECRKLEILLKEMFHLRDELFCMITATLRIKVFFNFGNLDTAFYNII